MLSAGADCNNNKHCGILSKVLGFYLAQLLLNSIHMLSYTHVKYSNNKENTKTMVTIYKVDKEGYLLDNDNCYLLDLKGNQIRLEPDHLKLLKKAGVA